MAPDEYKNKYFTALQLKKLRDHLSYLEDLSLFNEKTINRIINNYKSFEIKFYKLLFN